MAFAVCKSLTLFIIICVSLHNGWGLPLADTAEPETHPHHVRVKRCSCNNWDDKECIYFCHLDIIWVNTPSKLLPYGLGSPLSHRRRRRSADRCECLNPADRTCSGFCSQSHSSEVQSADGPAPPTAARKSNKLLESFRRVVKSNSVVAESTSNRRRLRKKTRS